MVKCNLIRHQCVHATGTPSVLLSFATTNRGGNRQKYEHWNMECGGASPLPEDASMQIDDSASSEIKLRIPLSGLEEQLGS